MYDDLLGRVFYDLIAGDYFKVIAPAEEEPDSLDTASADYPEEIRRATAGDGSWISPDALRERIAKGTVEDVTL